MFQFSSSALKEGNIYYKSLFDTGNKCFKYLYFQKIVPHDSENCLRFLVCRIPWNQNSICTFS